MPNKSDKIKIHGTKFDRRIKLTPEEKVDIKRIREEAGTSYQKIANQFNVSKRCVIFICKPESQEASKKAREERGGSKIYYDREKQNAAKKESRRYKQELYSKKLI